MFEYDIFLPETNFKLFSLKLVNFLFLNKREQIIYINLARLKFYLFIFVLVLFHFFNLIKNLIICNHTIWSKVWGIVTLGLITISVCGNLLLFAWIFFLSFLFLFKHLVYFKFQNFLFRLCLTFLFICLLVFVWSSWLILSHFL